MARIRLKLGDIFEVPLEDGQVGYFQYIENDETMLGGDVIRVFHKTHTMEDRPDLSDIIAGDIHFYAHTLLRVGLNLDLWMRVGNADYPALVDVLFRSSDDVGNPAVKISHRWNIWRINEPMQHVGVLAPEYQQAELGAVIPPVDIVHRMQTEAYSYFYPSY